MTGNFDYSNLAEMRRLGPYELVKILGSGGMAEVWMGRKASMGAVKNVAVKLLARHLADQSEYRAMFISEARLSMSLTHSNIVQVFDAATDDGECYMVMEWVDGLTLAEFTAHFRSEGRRLPLSVVAHITGELLRALAYAHDLKLNGEDRTIVHRDVSPQNVMLSRSGEVKLMDFGIARFSSEETSGTHVKGKLRYMPPEQLMGETRRPTVDLFAIGAILHELLDGVRFREGVTDETHLYGMILSGEAPSMSRAPNEIPRELDELRLCLLKADPNKRIASAREAISALSRWPGYRNASFELEALIATGPKTAEENDSTPTQFFVGADKGRKTEREPRPSSSVGTSITDSIPMVVEPRKHTIPLVSLLVTAGLGFSLVGAGFVLGWWGQEPAASPLQAAERPEVVEPAPPPVTGKQDQPRQDQPPERKATQPDPNEATRAESDVFPSTEPDKAEATKSSVKVSESSRSNTPSGQPVSVKFTANDYFFVYVKIGSKVLTVEPHATVRLKPGRHTIYLSRDKKSWSRAGSIVIEPEHTYEILMEDPPGIRVNQG